MMALVELMALFSTSYSMSGRTQQTEAMQRCSV